MSHDNISTYLNDHLAGSVAAIELIDDLVNASDDALLKQFLCDLKRDIESDQKVLEELIAGAGESEGVVRKAAAWLSEKAARAKFKVAGEDFGGLGLVQALEMLALGIRGKELLWRSLSVSGWPTARDVDLAKLEQRAIEQQKRVEEKRIEAVKAAFG
ncbi:MAG TPA: hypothetical protein VJ281_08615 [Chthoniobacterales bacterium]|jgi:hypothetical protein|nr:hypothetical protein [Chthoniobacterales bacterium]